MYLYNYSCILPVELPEELTQGNVKMMKIEDVVKIVEEVHAWIAARVVALNVGARDQYYKGYGNCGKKVDTAPKGIYECGECQHTNDDFKFKLSQQVNQFWEQGHKSTSVLGTYSHSRSNLISM
ncbi:hypothetical protein PIB30_006119 [Stylosanthes scabra]|uniref:Uncharacterized protein n=1 Tax=Stylosanthes scabra TaxID=79078 RepID=A0ABU6W2W6_9FABA|nr:hypothetical protein [Stylosanthes scabra]